VKAEEIGYKRGNRKPVYSRTAKSRVRKRPRKGGPRDFTAKKNGGTALLVQGTEQNEVITLILQKVPKQREGRPHRGDLDGGRKGSPALSVRD